MNKNNNSRIPPIPPALGAAAARGYRTLSGEARERLDDAAEALPGIYEAFDREWARASASPDRFKGQPAWVEWLWMSEKDDRAGRWDIGMVDG